MFWGRNSSACRSGLFIFIRLEPHPPKKLPSINLTAPAIRLWAYMSDGPGSGFPNNSVDRGSQPTAGPHQVYEGTFKGELVAIKTLKVDGATDREELAKVGISFENRQVVTHTRPGAPCKRGRWMEMASAQEYPAVYRCHIDTSPHDFYCFGTNGKWEHHGFHQGPPETQSSGSCEWREGIRFSTIIIFNSLSVQRLD